MYRKRVQSTGYSRINSVSKWVWYDKDMNLILSLEINVWLNMCELVTQTRLILSSRDEFQAVLTLLLSTITTSIRICDLRKYFCSYIISSWFLFLFLWVTIAISSIVFSSSFRPLSKSCSTIFFVPLFRPFFFPCLLQLVTIFLPFNQGLSST